MVHLITLGVGTDTDEERKAVFDVLSQIGGEMAMTHHYASVSCTDVDRPADGDEEFYDDHTMAKVARSIREALVSHRAIPRGEPVDVIVEDVIKALQNANILFRERRAS